MVEGILNWGGGGGAGGGSYNGAREGLTCRKSGDICKIVIL